MADKISKITLQQEFTKLLKIEQGLFRLTIPDLLAGVSTDTCIEYIQDLIFTKEPIHKVLRLLCLCSLTLGGLKLKVYEQFKKDVIQVYFYLFGINRCTDWNICIC